MEIVISKSKIDRLGNRLRQGDINEDDLRLLDEYRRSFNNVYEIVVGTIRQKLGLEPTGRPAKSTISITEKLQRESIRLTQMQDVAGCRLIVPAIAEQEQIVASILELVPHSTIVDRREKPSHGYRAVHVVVLIDQRSVEIQVRTGLQQVWAESSEKLADLVDPAIKYGGGDESIQTALLRASEAIARFEALEYGLSEVEKQLNYRLSEVGLTEYARAAIIAERERVISRRADLCTVREAVLNDFRKAVQELQE